MAEKRWCEKQRQEWLDDDECNCTRCVHHTWAKPFSNEGRERAQDGVEVRGMDGFRILGRLAADLAGRHAAIVVFQ